MFKRPEGRKRRQNTFQQFSIAKKACFRKIPEADFVLIPLPMLETAIFRNLCATHTAICAQRHTAICAQLIHPVLYDSCVARFLTLVRALETAGMLMMIIVRIASVKI